MWASPLAENSLQGLSPNFNNLNQRGRRNKGELNLFAGIILSRSLVVSQSICPSVSLSAAQPYFFFLDVDDCTEMTDNCDVNAYCNNTVGSFNCTCNSGFTGNGTTCAGKYDYFVVNESWFCFIPQSHARSAQKKNATCFQFSQNLQLMAKKDDCGILGREDHTRHKFLVHALFVNPV